MNDKLRGTVSIIFAVACYGLFGTLAKFVGTSFGIFTQNWVRNILVMLFIGLFAFFTGTKWNEIRKADAKWLLAWTLSGTLNTIFLFVSFNKIPIGTVYFLLYSSMIGTGFLCGKIFFGEKISKQKIFCLMLSILGLLIIYFWDIKSTNPIYVLLPLSAGIMVGTWNVLTKKVSDNYPNSQMVFIDATVSALVGIVGSLIFAEKFPTMTFSIPWLSVTVWAVAQLVATGLVVYGFKHLEAQIASVIMPIEVLFGTLFGFLFFGQVLPLTTFVGGLLIATAAAVASIDFEKNK